MLKAHQQDGSPTRQNRPSSHRWGMPERCSRARVRYAAPKAGAPLRTARRSGGSRNATGGSGGMAHGNRFLNRTQLAAVDRDDELRQNMNHQVGQIRVAKWAMPE